MKNAFLIVSLTLGLYVNSKAQNNGLYHNGDIIFQTTQSSQCIAIQLATHSVYSHCGMLYFQNNKWYVAEAIEPVKLTPLKEFISRGKDKHYVIKRARNISDAQWKEKEVAIKDDIQSNLGKHYDLYFNWDDSKIYCSELVWKVYKKAFNVEIGKLQALKEFDLTHPAVKQKLTERYGDKIPFEEQVISPAAMFKSELLDLVEEK
jgi:hypothetical protein